MKKKLLRVALLAAGASFAHTPAFADAHNEVVEAHIPGVEKTPMTAQDLIQMPRLGAPTVTPFGRYAVYSVTYTDPVTFARSPKHYLLDLSVPGSEPVEIDLGLSGSSLAFGPDSFLYFISYEHTDEEAEERARVWRVALEGTGNVTGPIPVADIAGTDIAGFKIAPSGDKIALWSEIARDCARFGCDPLDEPAGTGRLYEGDAGFYRHWDRWIDPANLSRVFVFGLEDGKAVGDGISVDGGAGLGNTPTMPFGGRDDVAWAPDGSGIYFVARKADSQEPVSTDLDVYWSDLSGDSPTELTDANNAHDSSPAPSPDGKMLAYLAMARPGYESDRLVVHLRNLETGETRALTDDTDLSFGGLIWSEDGKHLYASALHVLDTPVFRIDPESGDVTELNLMAGNEAHIANVIALAGGRLLFTRDSIGAPRELYLSTGEATARPLTDIVTMKTGEMASTTTRRFSFEGANGDTVWGQITRLGSGPINLH